VLAERTGQRVASLAIGPADAGDGAAIPEPELGHGGPGIGGVADDGRQGVQQGRVPILLGRHAHARLRDVDEYQPRAGLKVWRAGVQALQGVEARPGQEPGVRFTPSRVHE
jgi:hypothetical protein